MKIIANSAEQFKFVENTINGLSDEIKKRIISAEYIRGYDRSIAKIIIQGKHNGGGRELYLPKGNIVEINTGTKGEISIHYDNISFFTDISNLDYIKFD